ncbi:hypothetical protein H6G76_03070 [Nostoc sp. FACHB-152]|uniref:hypothetical protein n=1 Tax=unclassified Nostoc TaxID=2593658 RepID=UPI0016836395|nr:MULTISPECIES: hypothetical protein [unclassified Nostoc]MBD2446153.1 hypothetical protein [Nostoc sp. FACHB-152]MBD2467385.1 hypothetical protein [Nostoc sp. FACHB-145]
MQNFINQLGNLNPQLFRELKGRLKTRNILLATTISLLGQFILFMSFLTQIPASSRVLNISAHRYCTGAAEYGSSQCLRDGLDNIIINWQLWSFDAFNWLSIIAGFGLLVAGTYFLIHDLATEQRRDTLNFIRLSPQSPQSILWGKMLGVPILFYVAVLVAIPLHLCLGLNAQLPLIQILGFYAAILGASFLYFSAALLFGLVGSWLGSFQAWLGSGTLLGYLIFTKQAIAPNFSTDTPVTILGLLNPYFLIPNAEIERQFISDIPQFTGFSWFLFPLGDNFALTVCFALLLYFAGAYFIWESLQRCFQGSTTTILSKKQSYLLTACFTLITLGCANWQKLVFTNETGNYLLQENIALLMVLDFGLFLYLIAAVSPSRQTLQEWARYRHISYIQGTKRSSLIYDLIWGDKSPGILAIAINAAIAITGLSFLVLISQASNDNKLNGLIALSFAGSLAVIYAALTQLILFMKNEQRLLWASGVLIAVIVLPPIILALFFSNPSNHPIVWLFSVLAPILALSPSGDYKISFAPFLAILGHFTITALLVSQLSRKLKKAGESATKVLLAVN